MLAQLGECYKYVSYPFGTKKYEGLTPNPKIMTGT